LRADGREKSRLIHYGISDWRNLPPDYWGLSRRHDSSATNEAGNSPRKEWYVVGLQPMGQSVGQQGMKAGIGQHDFKPAGRRRVSVEYRL